MDTVKICKRCRQPLASDAPSDWCPPCLALGAAVLDAAPPGARIAPGVSELAPSFPRLEIVELIGMGGMGMVYKARQAHLERWIALKNLPVDSLADSTLAERFSREAKALARLTHPGIVTIYDYGRVDKYCFFVMEFVNGMTLRELLDNETLEPRQCLDLILQICSALQYAHEEGVIHRDIKPANILLNRKGQVKIADFGLAKLVRTKPDTSLTTSQIAMGTLNYMAPEQREDAQHVDHRADIYSLGVVFYEMLTGEIPMGRFDPPSKRADVDARLDEVVLRALEREPTRRFQNAGEIKTSVEAIIQPPTAQPPAPRRLPVRARRAVWGVAALLLAGVLALALRPHWIDVRDFFVKPTPLQLTQRAQALLLQYDQRGHIDQAVRALTLAVNQNPALTEAHAYLGLAYWRKYRLTKSLNDRGEAARAASDALALNADSDVGWFVQGLVAGDKRNLTEAVASLSRANEKANWENGEALLQLASLWETMGQESNADYFAAKAQRVAAKPWYFYNAAASFEFSRGNPVAAISNLQLAVKTDPKSPYAWLNLGLVLVYQTNKSERDYASTCLQKSMELNPTPAAYDGLGHFYFSVGQWREAAKEFAEAERLNPARYDFPGKTGLALMRLPGAEDRQAAREELLKAVDKAQTRLKEAPDALTAANLGLYQAALGQADEAVATFRRVAASSPGLGQLPDNIGTAAEYLEVVYHSPAGSSALRQLLSSLPTNQ